MQGRASAARHETIARQMVARSEAKRGPERWRCRGAKGACTERDAVPRAGVS